MIIRAAWFTSLPVWGKVRCWTWSSRFDRHTRARPAVLQCLDSCLLVCVVSCYSGFEFCIKTLVFLQKFQLLFLLFSSSKWLSELLVKEACVPSVLLLQPLCSLHPPHDLLRNFPPFFLTLCVSVCVSFFYWSCSRLWKECKRSGVIEVFLWSKLSW